eukprot:TRINITY_DN8124_c0_g2_i2.p1 TRINITY_DN8124_c0_g2~~TRINITY_DN8124_c0_g2_i2.p1  ORF type:complete len:115 (+),score=10.66 TRINITY_DN8124_c0_g2_i2:1088-1432(+)
MFSLDVVIAGYTSLSALKPVMRWDMDEDFSIFTPKSIDLVDILWAGGILYTMLGKLFGDLTLQGNFVPCPGVHSKWILDTYLVRTWTLNLSPIVRFGHRGGVEKQLIVIYAKGL